MKQNVPDPQSADKKNRPEKAPLDPTEQQIRSLSLVLWIAYDIQERHDCLKILVILESLAKRYGYDPKRCHNRALILSL